MRTSTEHRRIELLAYAYWEQRGRPIGSPDVDWFRAIAALHADAVTEDLPLSAVHTTPTE